MTDPAEHLLARVDERRTAGDTRIRLVDGGSLSLPLSDEQYQLMRAQRPEDLSKLGISIMYTDTGDGVQKRLKSSAFTGAARYVLRRNTLDVVVEPKVGAAPLFTMLSVCGQGLTRLAGETLLAHNSNEITDIVLEYALDHILAFLRRHYYRDYNLSQDPDSTRLRGRLLVESYIRSNLPRFRLHRAPCEFFDYSPDTLENRAILAALNTAGRMLSLLPKASRPRLSRKIALARSHLIDVSDVPVAVRDLASIRYHSGNKHFQPVHEICRLIIANSSVMLQPGQRLTFMCFAVNMNSLFEEYVRRLFHEAFKGKVVLPQSKREFLIKGLGRPMKIDLLLRTSASVSLGDCKNKLVTKTDTLAFSEDDLKHADIYQVVAYSQHKDLRAASAFLVYPVAIPGESAFQEVAQIDSFLAGGGITLPVRIFLLNLASPPVDVVNTIRAFEETFFPEDRATS